MMAEYIASQFEDGKEIKVGTSNNGLERLVPPYLTVMFRKEELPEIILGVIWDAVNIENKKGNKVFRCQAIDVETGEIVTVIMLEKTYNKQMEMIIKTYGCLPNNVIVIRK